MQISREEKAPKTIPSCEPCELYYQSAWQDGPCAHRYNNSMLLQKKTTAAVGVWGLLSTGGNIRLVLYT